MTHLLVAGSINMDVVARAHHIPQPGETVFGSALHFIPGGKGANQAVAAARLGGKVSLAGKLGMDAFGQQLRTFLQSEALDLTYLHHTDAAPTGTALITVSDDSENVIVVVPGSNSLLSPQDLASPPIYANDLVAAVFEIPQHSILALFQRARQAGARTLLNPAPAAPFIDGLLPLVDVLVINESELALIAGTTDIPTTLDAAQTLMQTLSLQPHQTLVVTLGKHGALAHHNHQMVHMPAHRVKAVDTTGAGDCFCGALGVALCEGRPLTDALAFANAAAALSVQHLGASASMPTRAQVDAFMEIARP
jgi:ribokinase